MGSNEGRAWVSLGGVGHVELSEGFFGLTECMKSVHVDRNKPSRLLGVFRTYLKVECSAFDHAHPDHYNSLIFSLWFPI